MASGSTTVEDLQRAVHNMDLTGPVLEKFPAGTEVYKPAIPDSGKNHSDLLTAASTTIGHGNSSSASASSTIPEAGNSHPSSNYKATVIFMLGMAGSGKTTFTQRLAAHLMAQNNKPYIINFDPACFDPPFPVNIDIRDTINYYKVMEQYNLGPNGAIVTSLNLFTTILDQVLEIVKSRANSYDYILVDTPGQLECFLWSASGEIILHTFAAHFQTLITFIADSVICRNPISFASNMMYGVTILYKSKLPLIFAMNKIDLDPSFGKTVTSWIRDFEALEAALCKREDYTANLASSLVLSLEEFYKVINHCSVSAIDGYGMKEYEDIVRKCVVEFNTSYVTMCQEMKQEFEANVQNDQDTELIRFRRNFHTSQRNEAFSMQATSALSYGIDIMPKDEEIDDSSEYDSEEDVDIDEIDETIGDFRTKEVTRRDTKKNNEDSVIKAGVLRSTPPQI